MTWNWNLPRTVISLFQIALLELQHRSYELGFHFQEWINLLFVVCCKMWFLPKKKRPLMMQFEKWCAKKYPKGRVVPPTYMCFRNFMRTPASQPCLHRLSLLLFRSCHSLNFFLLPFCKNIIDLPGGQINDSSLGKILFSYVPSSNPLSDPWGSFLE